MIRLAAIIYLSLSGVALSQLTNFVTSDFVDTNEIAPDAIFNLLPNSAVWLPSNTTVGGSPIGGGGTFTNLFTGPGTTGSVTSTTSDTNLFLSGSGLWANPIALSTQFETDSSDGETTRDGTGWGGGTKLDFYFTNNLGSAATAQINWYSEIYSSDSGTRCEVRLRVTDGGSNSTRAETDWNPDSNQKIGWGPNGGTDFLSVTNNEVIRLRMQFRTSQSGKDVSIRRARFFIILFKQ